MPGVFCIISKQSEEKNKQDLNRMLDCMTHEPFYSNGTYFDAELGLYAGWTALRESFSDCMPLINKRKDTVMLFAGENHIDPDEINSKEIREKAKQTQSASYLIDLFDRNNEQFFKLLNGFFHGIIVEKTKKRITIFNDRYGMGRLYYYIGKDEILFSSEAKAILRVRPFLKSIDLDSLGEYFSCNCVIGNKTLFKNIFLLPGGSKWVIHKNGHIDRVSYFSPSEWEQQPVLEIGEFEERLSDTFKKILPKYFRTKQNLGLALTGGLDTRMILAAADIAPGTLPCFTYGGMYRNSYDVKVSKNIAQACNQPHQAIRLDKSFLNNFASFAWKTSYLSDGLMDITGSPNLYVSSLARQIAQVRLTGNYGQEVLRRYIAFRPNPPDLQIFSNDFRPYVLKAKTTYADFFNKCHKLTFALFKQAPWFQYSRYSIEASQMTQRSPFLDNELVALVYRAPQESLNSEASSNKLIWKHNKKLGKIMTDLGKLGTLPKPAKLMVKIWRYFLFKMEWYYNHKLPRPFEKVDNAFSRLRLEKYFLGNHKYYHFRVWFRDELSEYINQILLDPKSLCRNYTNSEHLKLILNSHIDKNISNTDILCTLLSVELMHRNFID